MTDPWVAFCLLLLPKALSGGKKDPEDPPLLLEKHCAIHPQIRDRTWPTPRHQGGLPIWRVPLISYRKIALNMILLVKAREQALRLHRGGD